VERRIGRATETDVPDLGRPRDLHGGRISTAGTRAVGDRDHGPVAPDAAPHPVQVRANGCDRGPFRHPWSALAGIGGDENDRRAHAAPARSTCFTRSNHSTARLRATRAGCGEYPSSRAAFSCDTHIFFFAMR